MTQNHAHSNQNNYPPCKGIPFCIGARLGQQEKMPNFKAFKGIKMVIATI